MKILFGGCVVQCFFKRGYAAWVYNVDQDDETTAVLALVVSNQILPIVSRRVLRLEERTPGWDPALRLTRTHAGGREPTVGNTICLPSRALRPSSRALLACSIRSRQSGSCEGGRGGRAASSWLRDSSTERALGCGAIFGSSLMSIYQKSRRAWDVGRPDQFRPPAQVGLEGRRQTVGAARRPSAWRAVAPRPAPAAGGPGWSRILSSMRRQCVLGAGASTVNGGRDSIRGDHPQARGDHRRDRRPDRRPLAPDGLSPVPRRGRGRLGRAAAGRVAAGGYGWVISLNHFGAGSPVRRCKPECRAVTVVAAVDLAGVASRKMGRPLPLTRGTELPTPLCWATPWHLDRKID